MMPPIFQELSFHEKLQFHRSTGWDDLMDEIIQSSNDSYLTLCNSRSLDPGVAEQLRMYNINRLSINAIFEALKTTNPITTPEGP